MLQENSPTNHDVVTWKDRKKKKHDEIAGPKLLVERIYLARPIRKFGRYATQKHTPGRYWFASIRKHVPFESLLERSALIRLDLLCDITHIAAQPMRIVLADGRIRYPDYLALHANGKQVVYDVKPSERLTPKALDQFEATRKFCERVGWGYEVITEADQTVMDNIHMIWLHRYAGFHPAAEHHLQIRNLLEAPTTLIDLMNHVDPRFRALTAPAVHHLTWTGVLTFDFTKPLTNQTVITRAVS